MVAPARGSSRELLYNISFGPRTGRPTCINSGLLYLPEYPNGTGNRLKICRPSGRTGSNPVTGTISPLETIYGGWFIDYDYGDENVV